MKSISLKTVLYVGIITAIILALFQLPGCKQGGTCTYEGLECPNALEVFQRDSLVIDSLETVIAGYEFENHSRIPDEDEQVAGAGMIHLKITTGELPDLIYREHDGNEYHLDYVIDHK